MKTLNLALNLPLTLTLHPSSSPNSEKHLSSRSKKKGVQPSYLKIADLLRSAIITGRAQKGESLPSTRELAAVYGVHRHTVMAAFSELVAEGWVESSQRRSYRVCEVLPHEYFLVQKKEEHVDPKKFSWTPGRATLPIYTKPISEQMSGIRFAFLSGTPDLRLFPYKEFRAHLSDAFKWKPEKLLSYGSPAGHAPLIKELEIYLRRVRAISGRKILITHGSQEGIYLTAQYLLAPGDAVAVECQGYRPAFDAFVAAGARLVPVELDRKGVIPESIERIFKKERPKLLYLTPLHQYPTTVTLPLARRQQVYALAKRYQVAILEDDYDHEFHYRTHPLAPMASCDPDERVIYVSTFSKVLFPSARLGFMAVPPALEEPLQAIRRVTTRQNDALLSDAVARWMRSGGFEIHLRRMRKFYHQRLETLVNCLLEGKKRGISLHWTVPDGGMAIWLGIERQADSIVQLAKTRGVWVESGNGYKMTHGSYAQQNLRLGFANQRPEELIQGMEILLNILSTT